MSNAPTVWTESLPVPLHFAVVGEYWGFGELLTSAECIDWQWPRALYPPQRGARPSAQRGFFPIHGSDTKPLEEISPEHLVAIDLNKQAILEARHHLEYACVNEYSLFPDLDGLSRHLKAKYRV